MKSFFCSSGIDSPVIASLAVPIAADCVVPPLKRPAAMPGSSLRKSAKT
jgi:hypothetical protein